MLAAIGQQRRHEGRRIGGDRIVGFLQAAEILAPAADQIAVQRGVRDRRAWLVHRLGFAGETVDGMQRAVQIHRVQAQHIVGVAQHFLSDAGERHRMAARETVTITLIQHRHVQQLGQLDQGMEGDIGTAQAIGDDNRIPGIEQRLRHARNGFGRRRRRFRRCELLGIRQRREFGVFLFLDFGVVAHIDRTARLGHGGLIGAREGFGRAFQIGRLIVPFDEIAHQIALNQRGMHPVAARTALGIAHRPGAAQQNDRNAVAPGVVDGHDCVLQADHVVQNGDHRLAGGARVTVSDGHRDFLVHAFQVFRVLVAQIIHQRIVNAAKRRARIERREGNVGLLNQIDNEIGAVAALRQTVAW